MEVYQVILGKKVEGALRKLPKHIVIKLYGWVCAVKSFGLYEVRKAPGYHDEPLKGNRKGQRSIRLSKSYRAIYVVNHSGKTEIVEIIEVNKHEY